MGLIDVSICPDRDKFQVVWIRFKAIHGAWLFSKGLFYVVLLKEEGSLDFLFVWLVQWGASVECRGV